MASTSTTAAADGAEGLRLRTGAAKETAVKESNDVADTAQAKLAADGLEPKEAKVMGRTPEGTVFVVPHTPDMLTSIFDPRQPKTPLDLVTLFSLGFQLVVYFTLSRPYAKVFFFFYFAFWRAAYNAGLGHILKAQSEKAWIVKLVKREGWMDAKRRPKVHEWIKQQLVTKMEKDYDFDGLPLDYNIWLMFRSIVDVILLNDFVAYSLFAFSCTRLPEGHSVLLHVLRWITGWGLIFFNLWVKMDAHRVVKDYAWYWGDCFFLCLQSLVFDGVYEVAPDPMYSIGYAGYYGLSLVSGSYAVLFVSLAAHASQMAFLWFFESPHIERTYGEKKPLAARVPLRAAPYNAMSASIAAAESASGETEAPSPRSPDVAELDPTTRSQMETTTSASSEDELGLDDKVRQAKMGQVRGTQTTRSRAYSGSNTPGQKPASLHDIHHRIFRKDTVVFKNIDLLRSTDFLLCVAAVYGFVPLIVPRMGASATIFLLFVNALGWRAFHSFGLGSILKAQSESKWMVRHFLKHYYYDQAGDAVYHAFDNWKVIYNTSLVMTYASFGALCLKCYAPLGQDWTVGTDLLRHVLGLLLIGLHVWAANSSYSVLGPFGWFYGDFFVSDEYPIQLYHSGIFRFVNNPERTMGGAAFFGLALIAGSKVALTVAIISVGCHWVFLSTVEGPHLRKLYGEAAVKRDAGITKQIKVVASRNSNFFKAAQTHPRFQEMKAEFERVQKDATLKFEDFVNKSVPLFEGFVEDTRSLLQQSKDRLLLVREGDEGKVATIDRTKYSLKVKPSKSTGGLRFHIGEPIAVEWNAAPDHSRRDWIGLYAVSRLGGSKATEESRLLTKISSQGKWLGVLEDEWEGDVHTGSSSKPTTPSVSSESKQLGEPLTPTRGTSVFAGSKLPTEVGLYELRYHYDAKHNVLARSEPIEIYVDKPSDPSSFEQTYASLSNIIAFALDDAANAPWTTTNRTPTQSAASIVAGGASSASSTADSGVAGTTADPEDFAIYNELEAKRIAKGIRQAFDVDFTTEVICAEANLRKLAMDVVEARRLLNPAFQPRFLAAEEQ